MNDELSSNLCDLRVAFTSWINAEETRITKEVDFLKKVYSSLTDSAALELATTNASNVILTSSLDEYFPS